MAPESERAKKTCPLGVAGKTFATEALGNSSQPAQPEHNPFVDGVRADDFKEEHEYQVTEPTLTCSEVVERLIKECSPPIGVGSKVGYFDRTKAEQILHSWRERRVQELENCLGEIALTLKVGHGVGVAEQCRLYAENTLAKSDEWRERIRKGAKHDSKSVSD